MNRFSKVIDDLFYNRTLSEIKIVNEQQDELTQNTMLYKKIICKESGKHTISSIAKLLSVATTAVTQKVNELEKKNYITRKQSTEDKRISYLYRVDQECKCLEEELKRDEYVLEKLKEKYTEEDIEKFINMFEHMNMQYEKYDKEN